MIMYSEDKKMENALRIGSAKCKMFILKGVLKGVRPE